VLRLRRKVRSRQENFWIGQTLVSCSFEFRVGLGVEGNPCRQQPPFVGVEIDAGDHEAEAVLDLAVGFPRQIGDFIVTKSASFNDFGHGDLPIDFRGMRCACRLGRSKRF
jgi:hypothetical protein